MDHPIFTRLADTLILFVAKTFNGLESFFCAEKRNGYLWIFAIIFSFLVILSLNILTPLIADDFAYQLIFGTKEYTTGVKDIIQSQINHYDMWGGRSVVHFIAQLLLLMPPLLADILNSIVFILFIILIYLHIKGRDKRHSLSLFTIILLAAWFFLPMIGDTILWTTGSANYLWGTTIILLFLLPYRWYNGMSRQKGMQVITAILLFLGGIIAGWTNENTAAGMIIVIVLFLLFYRSEKWNIPLSHVIGLTGVIIGYIIMLSAPGNFQRGGEGLEPSLLLIAYRIFSYTESLMIDYGFLIIFFFVLAILLRYFNRSENNSRKPLYLSLLYLAGALSAIYSMILSPQFPSRAWFGVVTFLIISLGILIDQLNYREIFLQKIKRAVITIGLIFFCFSFCTAVKDTYRMYKIDKERIVLVEEAKKSGAKECIFYMNRPQTRFVHAEDINGNHLLVHHYGIHIEYK